jgi:hypothetical protein
MTKVNPQAKPGLQKYIFLTKANQALERLCTSLNAKIKARQVASTNLPMKRKQIQGRNDVILEDLILLKEPSLPIDCERDSAQTAVPSRDKHNPESVCASPPRKRVFTQATVVESLKIGCQGQAYMFCHLPRDVLREIMSHLSFKDLMTLCLVDKFWYSMAGNDYRWQEMCAHLALQEPVAELQQTYKNVYALSKVGRNKCQKCGKRTSRKLETWNLVVCKRCQGTVVVTKTQALRCYMLKEEHLKNLKTHETAGTAFRPKTILYLKHQVEQVAMDIWKGVPQMELECQKRLQRRTTLKRKQEELVEEIEKLIDSDDCTKSSKENSGYKAHEDDATVPISA